MSRKLTTVFMFASIVIALAVLGGLIWANTTFARAHPHEKDFLVPWLDAQTFLRYGNSPYSEAASQRAQLAYYGRLAAKNEDPLLLNLPMPIELFYFPLALVNNYPVARGLWLTMLEITLAGLGFLALMLTGWKPNRILLAFILLFSIFGVYGLLSLTGGGGSILVALGITGSLVAIRLENDELAGALLVLLLFKPAIAGAFLLFIVIWMIHQRRFRVLGGWLVVVGLLLVISFVLLPAWFFPFLRGLISHARYNPSLTVGKMLEAWWPAIGNKIGWGATIGLLVALFLEWRAALGKDFRHFLWTICLSLTAAPLLGIPVSPADFVILVIPTIFVIAFLSERWSRRLRWGLSGILVGLAFILPWLAVISPTTPRVQATFLLLVVPGFLLVFLYWLRWWAIRPPRTWLDIVREGSG